MSAWRSVLVGAVAALSMAAAVGAGLGVGAGTIQGGISTFALLFDQGETRNNRFVANQTFGNGCDQGSDAFGYTCREIAYTFEDISGNGTAVTLGDNDVSAWIDLGFKFKFYGEDRKHIKIGSNGFVTLYENGADGHGCCSGQVVPNATKPNGLIAGYWEDLNPAAGGSVKWKAQSGSDSRFIVQFTDVPHHPGGNLVTFQIVLYENTNRTVVNYRNAPSDGGTHTAAIENKLGTIGLVYRHGTMSLVERSVEYIPPA